MSDAMEQVVRNRRTKKRIRGMEWYDIVDAIHELEDEISAKEKEIDRLRAEHEAFRNKVSKVLTDLLEVAEERGKHGTGVYPDEIEAAIYFILGEADDE